MKWISCKERLPDFDKPVLCFCRIYGRYIGWHQRIDNTNYGNWHDGTNLGVLPPIYWQELPEPPQF